ncbi:MgtC/SapB family protein [Emcibacter sp. SYSU 3D8]|uniref:MgtC/SapB family protein n=1 Tax=Emcibacter sp. SYSU 3D8 TaxID=3133969 RepID=UPI0031FF31E0
MRITEGVIELFATQTSIGEMAARMGLAVLLGALLGIEREYRNRPAGLRTHMLVALAACTFMIIALEVFSRSQHLDGRNSIDLLRVIEAVTAGVAFLAAGTIITSGTRVAGLTTGASLWLTGAVGLACGIGYYVVAGLATILALFILVIIRVLERFMPTDDTHPGRPAKHVGDRNAGNSPADV